MPEPECEFPVEDWNKTIERLILEVMRDAHEIPTDDLDSEVVMEFIDVLKGIKKDEDGTLRYLNSPQFKKQYAKLPEDGKNPHQFTRKHPDKLGDLQQFAKFTAWNEGRAFGQQNPDPKQYANREELVEAVKTGYIPLTHVSIVENAKDAICDIINKHGLEE